jgi:CheY-like chemotaxis protein
MDGSTDAWRSLATPVVRRPLHSPPRILVADDDSDMLAMLCASLRDDGYEVREASDGGRLLVMMTRSAKTLYSDLDLVVTDIRMPVCSGVQILESLRAARCPLPVILTSGWSDDGTRARAESLGAVVLEKPFAYEALRKVMRDLFG